MDSYSIDDCRNQLALIVPTYFSPQVEEEQIRTILEDVFRDTFTFCRPDRLLAVVDRNTATEAVFRSASEDSVLGRVPLSILPRNRGKAGAVQQGLEEALERTDAKFFAARDCDGDHRLEDLPRMVGLAANLAERQDTDRVFVMGARPSLEKPMGWLREEWELLTNRVLVSLLDYSLARRGQVFDRRFLGGKEPDVQSGYRVYSRPAANRVVKVLSRLPEDRSILTFACESVPFAELVARGFLCSQVQRLTLVEQPVTSYGGVDLPDVYGKLFAYIADEHGVPRDLLLQMFDNELGASSLYFSDDRDQIRRCRELLCRGSNAPELPPWL